MFNILYMQNLSAIGGEHRNLVDLIQSLDHARFKPLVLTSKEGIFCEELSKLGIPYQTMPIGPQANSFLRSPLTSLKLDRLLRQENIHLIHTNGPEEIPAACSAAARKNIPLVCHIHAPPGADIAPALSACKTAQVVAASEAVRKSLPDNLPARVIYPAIGLGYGNLEYAGARVRLEYGFRPEHIVVGMVSRLDPAKGQDILVRAAKMVAREYPQVRFLILGDPPGEHADYVQQLKFMAQSDRLDKHFIFTGFKHNVLEFIAAMDIVVLPAVTSGTPRPVLEAMAMKKAVIASRLDSLSEITVDGQTGLLIPPNSPEELAIKVCQLISRPDLRRQLGETGYQRIKDFFNLQRQAREVEEVYSKALERPAASPDQPPSSDPCD